MRRVMSFFSGAVMGGLVGATMALLFTPSSGNALRDQIRDRANRVQDEVKKAAAARREELEQQLNELRSPKRPA